MSNIGKPLYGWCQGVFGDYNYGIKRIEGEGFDWIVVRDNHGESHFASFADSSEKLNFIMDNVDERE